MPMEDDWSPMPMEEGVKLLLKSYICADGTRVSEVLGQEADENLKQGQMRISS